MKACGRCTDCRVPPATGFPGLAHIRGGEQNETGIVFDGLTLSEPFHLKNLFSPVSVLDAEIVGAMDVYAGGFPVTGDRMSAMIDVRSVVSPVEGMRAIGASLYHTNGLAGGSPMSSALPRVSRTSCGISKYARGASCSWMPVRRMRST